MIRPGIRRLLRLPIRGKDLAEQDLDEEIRLHLEMRAEQLERQGLSPEAARHEAVRRFGPADEARRTLRDAAMRRDDRVRTRERMEALWQDLRFGVRQLLRSPGFALAAILTIALGIGANTAVFSVVDAVLLRPLPYEHPGDLASLGLRNVAEGPALTPGTYPIYEGWGKESQSFERLASYTHTVHNVAGGPEPARVWAVAATSSLLQVLGVQPHIGRNFSSDADQPGGPREVLLSYSFWQSSFGGDPTLIGRTVELSGAPSEVIGVLPRGFEFPPPMRAGDSAPPRADVWVPVGTVPDLRERGGFSVLGRLRPGVTIEQARAEMSALTNEIQGNGARGEVRVGVEGLHEQVVGPIRPALLAFLGAVGLVLLIACMNVGSLLLARLTTRDREVALRTSLGAGRGRITRQLLTESMVLALVGGALGVLLAWVGLQLLVASAPAEIPRLDEVTLSGRALAFTLAVSVGAGLLFGLLPALRATRVDLRSALSGGGRGGTAERSTRRIHSGLIVAEVLLAVALLTGAGLLIRSFGELSRVDLGLNTENLLTLELLLPPDRYPERGDVLRFYGELESRLAALPGVESVGMIDRLPLGDYSSRIPFEIVGRAGLSREETPMALNTAIRSGYFRTLGIPVLRGRSIGEQDAEETPPAVVVSRSLAERFWPEGDPVGNRIQAFGQEREIVGVVGDVRHHAPGVAPEPMIYFPQAQDIATRRLMTVAIRTSSNPEHVIGAARSEIRRMDPQLPISKLQTFDQLRSERTASERFNALLVGAFAAVALALAALGIYGVMSFAVAARTREIGVRMALGASQGMVLRDIVRGALVTVGIGAALGILVAMPLMQLIRGLLFGVEPEDPFTVAAVATLLIGVGLLAAWIPARKAAHVDPVRALRYE